MTRAELEALARRWISLWTAPVDWALFEQLHAADFEDCASAGRATDRAGYAAGLAAFIEAFPDLTTCIESLVIDTEQQRLAVRWSAQGTNRGRFLGLRPTGRLTVIRGIEIIEVNHGHIQRRWGEWDTSDHHAD